MSKIEVRRFPDRYRKLDAARVLYGDRVDRLGGYLWQSDDAADAAIASLAVGPETHALIGRALAGEAVGPDALRALIADARVVPPWVEWSRIDNGSRFFLRTGLAGGITLGARSLIYGYASPAGNKPLVFSGRLREAAGPRLHETSRFVAEVVRRDGMRPGGDGWKITLRVRLMHAQVRRMLRSSPAWRAQSWGLPINQHDMVASALLFSVVVIEGVRLLGVHVSETDSDDFMHLWRWVSHLIGVDPALMPITEIEAHRLGELIALTQGPPDEDSRALTAALLEHGVAHPDPKESEAARKTLGLARALCRHLMGEQLSDQLGVPRTRERFFLPAAIRAVSVIERARLRSPRLDAYMVDRGKRYWVMVLKKGLVYASTDFGLPDRLFGLGDQPTR